MRNLTRILGVILAIAGIIVTAPAVALLNQRFQFVRFQWGICDIGVAGIALSDSAAMAVFGGVGISLIVAGVALLEWPGKEQKFSQMTDVAHRMDAAKP